MRFYVSLLVLLTLLVAPRTRAARAMSGPDHLRLFMTAEDLPSLAPQPPSQDSIKKSPDGDDYWAGTRKHQGEVDAALGLVIETHWAFLEKKEAAGFLAAKKDDLSEGMPAVKAPLKLGDETILFYEEDEGGIGARRYIVLFRYGPVVTKLKLAQGAISKDRLFAGRVRKIAVKSFQRVRAVVGDEEPPPPPPVTGTETLTLPNLGLSLEVPRRNRWRRRTEKLKLGDEVHDVDWITGFDGAVKSEWGAYFVRYKNPQKADCKSYLPSKRERDVVVELSRPLKGYHPSVLNKGRTSSILCADLGDTLMIVEVGPQVTDASADFVRPVLEQLATVIRKKRDPRPPPPPPEPTPAPTPRPSPTPSPSPSPLPRYDDDDDWDPSFNSARFAWARFELQTNYILPRTDPGASARTRQRALGFTAAGDLSLVYGGEIFGLLIDGGFGLGYDFDGNVPLDLRVGGGLALNLGPFTIGPAVGVGLNTRGSGDDLTTHKMGGAFYWYPSGRLRFGLDGFGLEVWAARTFRGSISATGADRIPNQIRLAGRLVLVDEDEAIEYFLGGRWVRYEGSTNEDGLRLYPNADQVGGTIGIGLSPEELFE